MRDGKIGFGIIGCGLIANWHAKAIQMIPDAQMIGVVDASVENAQRFALEYGVTAYESPEQLLQEQRIDVVCICTPSGLHAGQAVMAAKAGKHVIIEKPVALTLKDADEVAFVCAQNGVKCAVISQLRFSPAVRKLKGAVDSGALGKIVTGDIYMKFFRSQEYYDSGAWRGTWKMDGGGALMNQGIHGIDLLLHVCGPVKTVSALARTLVRNIEVEDTAVAIVEFYSGALGVIHATTSVYPGYARRMEICGERGSIALEEDSIVRWDVLGSAKPEEALHGKTVGNAAGNPAAIGIEGHVLQIGDMVDAIRESRPPLIDAAEGRKPVELILAIYESSRTGKKVEHRK